MAEVIELTVWVCKMGHTQKQRSDVKEVWCSICASLPGVVNGRGLMKQRELFPNWSKGGEQ